MKNENRYTITPDKPSGGYRIFDTVGAGRFISNQMDEAGGAEVSRATGNFTIWKRKVDAEAWAYKLNNGLVGKFPPLAVYHDLDDDDDDDKRHQCVLDALVRKVVCSSCGKEYHGHNGSVAVGPAAAPVHSIKVTRYLGYDMADLTVDINCVDCGHGGLYEFKGNPLMDAGIVPRTKNIS